MKPQLFFCLACLLFITGCKNAEPVSPPVVLQLDVTLEELEVRSVKTEFNEGDQIGIALHELTGGNLNECEGNANIRATYNGKWTLDYRVELSDQMANIYGYYPYSPVVKDIRDIPLQVTDQTDYLYAIPTMANETSPLAILKMKHALALVSFTIDRGEYQGEGKISGIEMNGVGKNGVLNAVTGNIVLNETGTESYPCDFYLNPEQALEIGVIVFPKVIRAVSSPAIVQFRIDDKPYYYQVADCTWESGKIYHYSLVINKDEHSLLDVADVAIESWSDGGRYAGQLVGEHYVVDIVQTNE